MPGRSGTTVEIESLDDFDRLVAAGATSMRGWRVQGVDLQDRTTELLRLRPDSAVLLGSAVSDQAQQHLLTGGALLFPSIPALPFEPYRASLYTPDELYAGIDEAPYDTTLDASVYAWTLQPDRDLARRLARVLHDHAIDDALEERLADRRVVGVMGGHNLSRTAPAYAEAVQFGRSAAQHGLYVASGGGPGAMEAANLGAYLADADPDDVDAALQVLAAAPAFQPSVTDWVRVALEVRRRWPGGRDSLGIPTWFYGHEPPNAFATSIAKYFQNALREAILLSHCDAGIVFLPGAAGTVQEIFQDACENYYAPEGSVAPMILVGVQHWQEEVPAWPLLCRLAAERPMATAVHLVDTVDDAVAALAEHAAGRANHAAG